MSRWEPRNARVLHAPLDIAGQAGLSVRGLREIGVEAHLFAPPHPFAYEQADIVPPEGRRALLRAIAGAVRTHDIFHFYYGAAFMRSLRLSDVRMLRMLGKRVVVEFVGSDVRMPTVEARRNPHYVALDGENDVTAMRLMRRWSTLTGGHAVVCDHSLDPFLEHHFQEVHYVGQRVDTRRYRSQPPAAAPLLPVLMHAPSDRAGKGTAHVRRAVDELRAGGLSFRYVELHDVPHEEVIRRCAEADLVVDQLCSGAHGVFAVEAMSLAKPVICNLLPEYAAALPPDCPIINADPLTIVEVLRTWLTEDGRRREAGLNARAYVERHHDIRAVAQRLLGVYEQLPGRPFKRPRRSPRHAGAATS